jgi:tRNA A37 threonylcarbamoyladenosine synthetase subunit TsaC/SUA5/YrdC
MSAAHDLTAALAALRGDGVIVYPTETFYGLGARARCCPADRTR